MNKNPNPPTNNKIFEDAAKKLQLIEKNQRDAERYFKERDNAENKMKLLESNLKKKVKADKRSSLGFEEKTIDKLQSLLKSLSNFDLNILHKIEDKNIEKSCKLIQTDQDDTQMLKDKLLNVEKENEKMLAKKNEYKKQNMILKTELDNLKQFNDKISKENHLLQQNLEDVSNLKSDLENRLREAFKQIEQLLDTIKKGERILKENEELKNIMEEKLDIEKESVEVEVSKKQQIMKSLKGNLKILVYFNELHHVTQFLNPKDINNLKETSKIFYQAVEKNLTSTKNYYKNIIYSYKSKVEELKSLDLKKEYMVNDNEIERLIKDYVMTNKLPGKELKSVIVKALGYMAKDVKAPLGIKSTVSSTPRTVGSGSNGTTPGGNAGLLGGFGSLFGGMFKSQLPLNSPMEKKQISTTGNSTKISTVDTPKGMQSVPSSGSKASSRGMSIAISNDLPLDIERYDKFLISENINPIDFYDFEYNTPDEIRNILNRFLKSNFSTEKLTAFIKEICLEYSELLFFANKSINEIKELEIVKNALNDRYRRYHKLSSVLENELTELKKSMLTINDDSKDKFDLKEKMSLESKYYSTSTDVTRLREQVEVLEKKLSMIQLREDQINSEYESFKIIFLKEIRNLKFDLEHTIRQRNTLRDVLIEFKNYFFNSTMSR